MLAKVCSGAVLGVDAYPVEIEVNAGSGEVNVVIVGLPDAAVRESKDRVWTAISNSGFSPPMGRTTINLAPADTKKEGPSFDLPIAVGVLMAEGELPEPDKPAALVGELAAGSLSLIMPERIVLLSVMLLCALAALVFIGGGRKYVAPIYNRIG